MGAEVQNFILSERKMVTIFLRRHLCKILKENSTGKGGSDMGYIELRVGEHKGMWMKQEKYVRRNKEESEHLPEAMKL